MALNEARSSGHPRCRVIGRLASSRGGSSELSAQERVNLGGDCGLHHLGTTESSSGDVASSDSDVSDEALSAKVGVLGSLSHIQHLECKLITPLHQGFVHLQSCCTAPQSSPEESQNGQHISGVLWPMPLFLWLSLPNNLEFP